MHFWKVSSVLCSIVMSADAELFAAARPDRVGDATRDSSVEVEADSDGSDGVSVERTSGESSRVKSVSENAWQMERTLCSSCRAMVSLHVPLDNYPIQLPVGEQTLLQAGLQHGVVAGLEIFQSLGLSVA